MRGPSAPIEAIGFERTRPNVALNLSRCRDPIAAESVRVSGADEQLGSFANCNPFQNVSLSRDSSGSFVEYAWNVIQRASVCERKMQCGEREFVAVACARV
jgi:hypothetical protein